MNLTDLKETMKIKNLDVGKYSIHGWYGFRILIDTYIWLIFMVTFSR